MSIELCFSTEIFFASYPQMMGKVLGIVYRTFATHITKKAGYNKQTAQTGAVTLIQRFGSALNLNTHFHMLYLDGVYAVGPWQSSCHLCVFCSGTHACSRLRHRWANKSS